MQDLVKFPKKFLKRCLKSTGIYNYLGKKYVRFATWGVKSDYLVVAMKRSGHHAIINWLRDMQKDTVLYNDCDYNGTPYNIDGNFKATVVFRNFENFRPNRVSKMRYLNSILVIRDPWNQFCSYRRRCINFKIENQETDYPPFPKKDYPPFLKEDDIPLLTLLWKTHAKEALGETQYLKNKTVIIYDKWFDDEEYRKKIAQKLNLKFNDKGKKKMTSYGGGSSFDLQHYEYNPELMKVKERWKQCVNDPLYIKFFKDEELKKLSVKMGFENRSLS